MTDFTLTQLNARLGVAQQEVRYARNKYDGVKREFTKAETDYIYAREQLDKAQAALTEYCQTRVLTTVDEDAKAVEASAFVSRLPAVMALVDAQDAARNAKKDQVDLDQLRTRAHQMSNRNSKSD